MKVHQPLPSRLLQVLPLLARGLTNQQAARRLGRSASQLGHDIEILFARTGAKSRGELIAYAYVENILDPGAWPPALLRETQDCEDRTVEHPGRYQQRVAGTLGSQGAYKRPAG